MAWPFPKKVEEAHQAAVVGQVFLPASAPVDISSAIRPQGWQIDAWRLWRLVGELHSPTTNISRIASRRLEYQVEENGKTLEPAATDQVFKRALGSMSLEEAIRLMTLNLQVTGEFWLIQDVEGWRILSVTTDKLTDIVEKTRSAGRVAQRVYDADPADQDKADASFRTVLDPAEDLVTLSALSRAQSRSRIAQAGLLLVPVESQFNGDPFGAGLEQAMTTAIKDASSASAMVPIKIEMSAEHIDKVKHVNFERPYDDKVAAKVEQATKRIALGLDVPPELLLGMGDMNHWNAWATREDTYNSVIAPLAEKVAGVLEYMVLTATGRAVTVDPDPSELLVRNPTPGDVLSAANIGAASLESVRAAINLNEGDAPSEADLAIIRSMSGGNAGAESDTSYGAPAIEDSEQENS